MQVLKTGKSAKVYKTPPPPLEEDLTRPTLDRIRERGFIRVGYTEFLPFQFFNGKGELVGFDAAMAHELARELDVGLEFVPIELANYAKGLEQREVDIVMTGLVLTPARAERTAHSEPYLDTTLAFVVKDHRRDDFNSRGSLRSLKAPRIVIFAHLPHYTEIVRKLVPNGELISIKHPNEFFLDKDGRFDALEFSAEMGSAYSLLYPEYSVAIPRPEVISMPLAYFMLSGDPKMLAFVNAWLELKKRDGTTLVQNKW